MIGAFSAGDKRFRSCKYKQKEYSVLLKKIFAEMRNRTWKKTPNFACWDKIGQDVVCCYATWHCHNLLIPERGESLLLEILCPFFPNLPNFDQNTSLDADCLLSVSYMPRFPITRAHFKDCLVKEPNRTN